MTVWDKPIEGDWDFLPGQTVAVLGLQGYIVIFISALDEDQTRALIETARLVEV